MAGILCSKVARQTFNKTIDIDIKVLTCRKSNDSMSNSLDDINAYQACFFLFFFFCCSSIVIERKMPICEIRSVLLAERFL